LRSTAGEAPAKKEGEMYANQVKSLPAAEYGGRQYTGGRYLAVVYRRDLRCVITYRVDVSLVPGYSSRDHMFDIALMSIARALRERPCYSSTSALERALRRAAGAYFGQPRIALRCSGHRPSTQDCKTLGITPEQVRYYELHRRWPPPPVAKQTEQHQAA
jgi:hypothetical protein